MSSSDSSSGPSTRLAAAPPRRSLAEGVRLVIAAGPDRGRTADLGPGRWTVGTDTACSVVLTDGLVSRRHLEIAVDAREIRLTDLGSTNGTWFQGARFQSITVPVGAVLRLGDTELKLAAPDDGTPDHFGRLVGVSAAMREVFGLLEKVAATELPVLLQGETGTGKELVAEALHAASGRAAGPLVVADLAAPSADLIESELFGNAGPPERDGAFVRADGGTLVLDQIGELEPQVQPRLLRALERRQIGAVGGTSSRVVDVRVIAATNRDLEADVEGGRFREDLYHRLAVARVVVPPLRERREDIPLLVEAFVAEAAGARPPPAVPPEAVAALAAHDWPGNVRQLRNVLERAVLLSGGAPVLDVRVLGLETPVGRAETVTSSATGRIVPFKEAKDRLVDAWEREYVLALLDRTKGNVSLASRRAGITRVYLHQLIRKHNVDR